MMAAAREGRVLEARLERLAGDEGSCGVTDYESLARSVRRSAGFAATLRRSRALADEQRLLAVALLRRRPELCACEIQAATGLSHPTVSHHMAILVEAGIVRARRKGKWLYYRLADRTGVAVP